MFKIRLPILMACALLIAGCGELAGVTTVSGEVHDQEFDGFGGTAEQSGDTYTITIADDSGFDCFSTPHGDYLTIVIAGVDDTGSYSAVGNVSFNSVRQGFQDTENATGGTVQIDRIDGEDEPSPRIVGSIDAHGPTSDVAGDFSVRICS